MDKLIPNVSKNESETTFLKKILTDSSTLARNFLINSVLSGHNNQIYLIGLYGSDNRYIGDVCLKFCSDHSKSDQLRREVTILSLLRSHNIPCPRVIDSSFQNHDFPWILMESVEGQILNRRLIDLQTAQIILDAIIEHELVLVRNLKTSPPDALDFDLNEKIDFESKLLRFLQKFIPNFTIKNSLSFLNDELNSSDVIRARKIVTDRSTENFFIGNTGKIVMIDFSTVRVGTRYDNWIQFIDDPTAKFSCSKEELKKMFFNKQCLGDEMTNSYYISAIYTNLLQGIFTYQKNPQISRQYMDNANNYYQIITRKKGVLIEINH